MMNTNEVQLKRDNGYKKTEIVDEYMYENKERLLAESQNGITV